MILQCEIGNNLSFNGKQRIIAIPSSKAELVDAIITEGEYNALPVLAFYGKNASGKTNALKSIKHIFSMVTSSHNFDPVRPIPLYTPFAFTQNKNKETTFEIVFVIDKIKYVYGFAHNSIEILEEYLYVYRSSKATKIFDRDVKKEKEYTFGTNYKDLEEYISKTHKNKLFLSIVAQWAADKEEINNIYNFFRNGMKYYQKDCNTPSIEFDEETTNLLIGNEEARNFINRLIKYLDLEFKEVGAKKNSITLDVEKLPENFKDILSALGDSVLQTTDIKTMYEVNNCVYELNLNYESNGVKKIYQFFSLLFYALNSKQIVVIDEIEMGLHPALVEKIIQLFQDRSINKYGSQLIFSTQSTTILKTKLLRRDQIYLTERNKEDFSTEIYPLSEIKGVRTTDNIERDYLNGLYVNIPSNRGWLDDLDG